MNIREYHLFLLFRWYCSFCASFSPSLVVLIPSLPPSLPPSFLPSYHRSSMQLTAEKEVCPVIVAILSEVVGSVHGSDRTHMADMLRCGVRDTYLLPHLSSSYPLLSALHVTSLPFTPRPSVCLSFYLFLLAISRVISSTCLFAISLVISTFLFTIT